MKRRGLLFEGNDKNKSRTERVIRRPARYSVFAYIAVLFAVMLFLILLSWFASQRSESNNIIVDSERNPYMIEKYNGAPQLMIYT